MRLFEHGSQVRDMLQDAVGEDRAVGPIRLGNGVAATRNELDVCAKLSRALKFPLIRVDSGIDLFRKQYLGVDTVTATNIEDRPLENQSGVDAALEDTLEGKRQGRAAHIFTSKIRVEFQSQRLRAFKFTQTRSISSLVSEG